jgi:hypothetical protein
MILFFFTACQQDLTPEFIKKIPHIFDNNSSKKSEFIKDVRENPSDIPDIYGVYNLIEGSYSYGKRGILKKEKILASTIVIEQLSENEFGFYYVTELKDSLINRYFGGFTYKDGRFYQKVIDYPTSNTTLRDNITLTKKGNLLRLTVNSIDEQRTILWGRSYAPTKSLENILEEEKENYLSLYKKKLFP